MIKLYKLEEPEILKNNKDTWTKEYLDCIKNDEKPSETIKSRYRNEEIKKKILIETNDKCAYCESKVGHVCPGDIEHILPKNKNARPELYVSWENLTLACEECNRKGKKTYYDVNDPLVNPYEDDPELFFMGAGPFIYHKPGSRKGEITEKILKLNRTQLWERRKERLEYIKPLLDKWANEKNVAIKSILEDEIIKEASDDKEYSFVVKCYLRQVGIAV